MEGISHFLQYHKLVPITMNEATLTKAASASPKCVDNRGYTGCQIYSVTVQNNSTIAQYYNIELTRLSGVATPNVDAVTMGTNDNTVTDASSIKDNGLICKTTSVANGETTTPCYFMVLIKNLDTPQNNSGTFTGTVTITSDAGAELKTNFGTGEKLTTTISNLYNNASKSTVTNNGITYNYANSVSLMNDRLGTTSTGINDGNIRYYGASPNNYVDIGDHYEEDTVIKNWVEPFYQFGLPESLLATTSEECLNFLQCSYLVAGGFFGTVETCEAYLPGLIQSTGYSSKQELCSTTTFSAGTPKALYRIIGLFKDIELSNGTKKDLIKVIRNDSIGSYSWDQSPENINNGSGINEWSQADLMKLLNPGYESETVGGSLYWNSNSGSCYRYNTTTDTYTSASCDFTSEGLNINAKNNIEAVKWNLGGWDTNNVFANDIYGYERGITVYQIGSNSSYNDTIPRTTLWTGRIALPYPSDYGYAVDFNSCNSNLIGYNFTSCTESNWMYNSMTANGILAPWLLTPYSDNANYAWHVTSGGTVDDWGNVNVASSVYPVFYLDSELTIESGSGKSDDPYVLR